MPLFGHRENLRRLMESGVPGLSEIAVRQGWEPVPGAPETVSSPPWLTKIESSAAVPVMRSFALDPKMFMPPPSMRGL